MGTYKIVIRKEPIKIISKLYSNCRFCFRGIFPGEEIQKDEPGGWIHVVCYEAGDTFDDNPWFDANPCDY